MKLLSLVVLLLSAYHAEALPTFGSVSRSWGVGLGGGLSPGWSGGIGGIYPGISVYPSGLAAGPIYGGIYSQSPSYPGYVPGLYGQGYLNYRG